MEIGLRQGDALSPTLLNIVLDSILRKVFDDATDLSIAEGRRIN